MIALRRTPSNARETHIMRPSLSLLATFALAASASLGSAGCASHEYVRGADDPTVDAPAMSTSLDRDDIQSTLQKLLNQMRDAPVMTEWRVHAGQNDRQTVAIAPFFNETTEHIDPQLDSM